jgi:hypothetical protein
MTHEQLCEEAKKAISAVFSDRSVSARETMLSLRDLRDDASMMADTIESDPRQEVFDDAIDEVMPEA